ncbi:MAG: preprotein translocase subunit SecG [Hyphomonadaceae bacterium]|nr:preprotein translocase subunit SecG [Hyphomonadaceae bacterium]
MQNMILVLHLLIAVVLVGAVLMQRSEGGALGMGGGGTGGLISGRGAADMMVNITSWVGGAFFVTSIILAVLAGVQPADRSVIDNAEARKGGVNFSIPGLPSGDAQKTETPPAAVAPPAVPAPAPVGAALAPAPQTAVTRAGPLSEQQQPTAAPKAPAAARAPVGAVGASAGGGASPPVGAAVSGAPAPMIPLPAAPRADAPPASGAESGQSPVPAPPPSTRDKSGPDE